MQNLPKELTQGIRGCVSVGPGSLTNFRVNGKLVAKRVTWKEYCILDVLYGGLVCDSKLVARMHKGDAWSADKMINRGTVVNRIDETAVPNVEEVKRKSAKRGKIIHL